MPNQYNPGGNHVAGNTLPPQFNIPANLKPHSIQKETPAPPPPKNLPSTSGGAQKREAPSGGGHPGQVKQPKTVPTTAAAAAQSVAAAAVVDKKNKTKEAWDKTKKKNKFIRAAAGETWEDESLLEWDPGES